tara:strand:- start:35 stop:577 length:543 start_codon:yes stop_codon:yes gene_type:complete
MSNRFLHDWEYVIKRVDSKLLLRNPGRILNIGHGTGIMDSFISRSNPKLHTIVERNPIIAQKAKDAGYDDVYVGSCLDFIKECKDNGIRYDGIYFDSYYFAENEPDWVLFTRQINDILDDNGTYCYFNGNSQHNSSLVKYLKDNMWSVRESTKYPVKIPKWLEDTQELITTDWTSISWKK